jgi:Luciferase
MDLAERVASLLLEREGVEERRSRFGHETAFYRGGLEFLHFHGEHAVDVRLGLDRIRERRVELETRPGVRVRESGSSDWVVVALEREEDAEFVLELVDELLAHL